MHLIEQEQMLDRMKKFDMSVVTQKFATETNTDAKHAAAIEAELKKFLFLAVVLKHKYAISGVCDPLWHTLIIHTETYQKLCEEVFGRFIHHRPKAKDSEQQDLRYFRFLVDYFRYFKEIPPASVWPLSDVLFGTDPNFDVEKECIAPCAEV